MRYSSLICLALLSGCAGGKMIVTQEPTRKLSGFGHLRIRTTAAEEAGRGMLTWFTPKLLEDVRGRGIFATCLPDHEAGGDLLLHAHVASAVNPHNAGTSAGGTWRGAGKMSIDCVLQAMPSGEKIGTFTITEKSGALGAGGDAAAQSVAVQAALRIGDYIAASR